MMYWRLVGVRNVKPEERSGLSLMLREYQVVSGDIAASIDQVTNTLAQFRKDLEADGHTLHYDPALPAPVREALAEINDFDPKELTGARTANDAIQLLAQHLNTHGAQGEFKFWPKGTYRGPYPEHSQGADFSMTMSGTLADFWEESPEYGEEFGLVAQGLGYHYEMGSSTSLHFYADDSMGEPVEPAARADGLPAPDLNIEI